MKCYICLHNVFSSCLIVVLNVILVTESTMSQQPTQLQSMYSPVLVNSNHPVSVNLSSKRLQFSRYRHSPVIKFKYQKTWLKFLWHRTSWIDFLFALTTFWCFFLKCKSLYKLYCRFSKTSNIISVSCDYQHCAWWLVIYLLSMFRHRLNR